MQKNITTGEFKLVFMIILLILVGFLTWKFIILKKTPLSAPVQTNNETPEIPKPIPQIEGNKDDLVSLSITPGQVVSGSLTISGSIKNGYFFEANAPVVFLDSNRNPTPYGPRFIMATSEWMTADAVSFSKVFDFTEMPKGQAYIVFKNDNPSGMPENDKSIIVPVIVK